MVHSDPTSGHLASYRQSLAVASLGEGVDVRTHTLPFPGDISATEPMLMGQPQSRSPISKDSLEKGKEGWHYHLSQETPLNRKGYAFQ